jgi:putative phage-type endonuclease
MTDIEQGSVEWFQARRGKVTASRVADLMAKTKSGWGASRSNYMSQLLCERLTGTVAESFSNAAMQWGVETEPRARAAYEFLNNATVDEVGFVDHPSIEMSGASPDGLVGDDGMLEIKCPNTATHIATLLDEKIPKKYIDQMQWQMACAGRQWCDFVSFDPRMPEGNDFFCTRLKRDEERIAELEKEITDFLAELDDQVLRLTERLNR